MTQRVQHNQTRPCCNYPKAMSVRMGDTGKPLYHCHAGCDQADLMAVIRGTEPDRRPHVPTNAQIKSAAKLKEFALRLWEQSLPAPGTLVEKYLRSRGIERVPERLRFLPSHKHKPTETFWPVMVAAVTDTAGIVQAIHRTYLDRDGSGKAPLDPPKMTLGNCAGFAVQLAAAGQRLAVAEGLETAASIMQSTGIPTWAALSTGGMRRLVLPASVREVVICADNDAGGWGMVAARSTAERWSAEGRAVQIVMPPVRGQDANDVLRARGALRTRLALGL